MTTFLLMFGAGVALWVVIDSEGEAPWWVNVILFLCVFMVWPILLGALLTKGLCQRQR